MKRLTIVLFFIILSSPTKAQVSDSTIRNLEWDNRMLLKRVGEIEQKQNLAGVNLIRHAKSYKVGIAEQLIGIGAIVFGSLISSNTEGGARVVLLSGGASLSLIGTITIIRSHGHIGVAGQHLKHNY